jgi:aquaporin NIP
VTVLIYALGHVSGAHFNPAVTLGFLAGKQIRVREALLYLFVQLAGAALASFTLRLLFGTVNKLGATLPSGTWMQSWGMEFLLTFLLMLVILGVATDRRAHKPLAGIAIGGTVGLDAMFGGPISGASMNPARSFGPALVSGTWEHLWIYFTAPVLGALAAVLVWRMIHQEGSHKA